ncbi:DNA polymerase III subunit delta [Anaerobium acetethylicum]|uniref:DNA polymerase III subunit delta n=1 Tax=Anaerobium acetethylicum TaxID=1619234 RepID=A0A1D3TT40_9FIRM|nr:DNA polymerase III subunit delta [Anaerobium acetethylicum]SCP97122.1 DNA polymerase III, delta subunit [Anaerobium acetethylicum]
MKSINEDLKTGNFKQIYLLYGEEAYLKRQYKEKLVKALVEPGDTMNYGYFEGKKINVKEIIDLSETMPFFADRRLIVVENSGLFKGEGQELADYLKELPETSYFIFVESEIDKRSRLFKAVKDIGRVTELGRQNEKMLISWILGKLKGENKRITENTMMSLLNKTGADMENIDKELEKLICYTLDRDVITDDDVEEVCITITENRIFDMINFITERKQKEALDLYYDLLALKEPPMKILFLIARQFNLLMQAKDLMRLGYSRDSLGQKMGLPGFIAGKYMVQARNFSMEILKEAVEDCVQTEQDVKTGKINDLISVELIIVKYSGKQANTH